jgi:nucleoside-diphosphate-sugar epimerase
MSLHVIIGAGPVGSATAERLARAGEQVRVVTRSGSGPRCQGVENIAADATDTERLAAIASGAAALYNCASPAYHRWPQDWPPLADSLLAAAERTGAVLVTMSNLYGYGPAGHPMTEDDPLAAAGPKGRTRAAVWVQALAAYQAGRARVTEARASDFFGPGVRGQSPVGQRSIPRLLAGRAVSVLGDPDVPHSWTYVPDIAAALITLGTDERAWGRAWHVPTTDPMTQREIYAAIARLAGAPPPRLRPVRPWLIRAGGLLVPGLREFAEVAYQFTQPFVVDSAAYQATFGARPTPVDQSLSATLTWWHDQGRAAAPQGVTHDDNPHPASSNSTHAP